MIKDEIEERAGQIPRRHVKELELFEVSLISDGFNPAYTGTSVETRAEEQITVETRAIEDTAEFKESAPVHNYSSFEERINQLTHSSKE